MLSPSPNCLNRFSSERTIFPARLKSPSIIKTTTLDRVGLEFTLLFRLASANDAPAIIATTKRADEKKISALRDKGIEVLVAREDGSGGVDLNQLLKMLGQRGISSVLVEGGAGVVTSLLRLKLVDKLVIIIAPKLMGKGIEAVGELNITDVSQALKLSFKKISRMGEDLVIEARVEAVR